MKAISKMNLVAATSLAGAALLYRFPPDQYSFYPACPIFHYLHVYCPGCGATRAASALLHLRIADAMHYNGLLVLVAPVLLGYFALAYWKAARNRNEVFLWPRVPTTGLTAVLVLSLAFGVLRNFLGGSL